MVLLGRAPRDTLADLLSVAVDGLLSRSIEGPELLRAIERVDAGERYVDPALLTGDAPDEEFEPLALTAREREVLGLRVGLLQPRDRVDALRVVADRQDAPRTSTTSSTPGTATRRSAVR